MPRMKVMVPQSTVDEETGSVEEGFIYCRAVRVDLFSDANHIHTHRYKQRFEM